MSANSPIPDTRLKQICNDACDSALSTSSVYDHSSAQPWNNTIINAILKSLISESNPPKPSGEEGEAAEGAEKPPPASQQYKFAVNSTIIQHLSDPRPTGGTQTGDDEGSASGTAEDERKVGRRGMHSASGAYWNNEKDGMWSFKYSGAQAKGMDVVLMVMWVGV